MIEGCGGLEVSQFEGNDGEWDGLVTGFDGSTFAHLSGWRRVLHDATRHEVHRWVVRDTDGAVVGLMPLTRVTSKVFGDYLISMPFVSYGGPLGSNEARRALVQRSTDLAAAESIDLLELRSREILPGPVITSDRKLTVVKQLPTTSDELWSSGLRSKVRSQVRRPIKEGMTTRFGLEHIPEFYRVFSRTMRDLGTPVLPESFFECLAAEFPEQLLVGVVDFEGGVIAAGCGFHWKTEVEISWAGSSRAHQRLAPNMLLYWSFMEEAIRRGATEFNFGRCTSGSSTHRFKKQWGSEEAALPWGQWSSSGTLSTPDPDSRKYRMARAVWTRSPLWLTNRLGPHLARSLP